MSHDGETPKVGVGASRVSPGAPTGQAETIMGAVAAGLQAASSPGVALDLGRLRIRLHPGVSTREIEDGVRRAISEAQARGRP